MQRAHVDVQHLIQGSQTIEEILGQPVLWEKILGGWFTPEALRVPRELIRDPGTEILLAGAGSSFFVAEAVAWEWRRSLPGTVTPVATTDLVTHPERFFRAGKKQVLVSFARSGNSPESVASVELGDLLNPTLRHLFITCNAEGALARRRNERTHCLLLPPEANDRGLAMVGSVTGMILVALLLIERAQEWAFTREADEGLRNSVSLIQSLAKLPFTRVVCLGSGMLQAFAREAQLKVQELSDGRIMGAYDSFLGFRHGPKAIVDRNTLVIYFLSPDRNARAYETDLTKDIASENQALHTLAIAHEATAVPAGARLILPRPTSAEPTGLLSYLPPVQLLGALKARELGLNPDAPSPRGAIHRVVQGVTIYPYQGA